MTNSPSTSMPIPSSIQSYVFPGRLMVLLGVVGGLLWLAAEVQGLPAGLQSFIRSNAAMWALISGVLLVVGIRLQWLAGHQRTVWSPAAPGVRFRTVVVYSRTDCLLCEEAMEILAEYRRWVPTPSEVNIDEVPELLERFDDTVPVVEIDGRIRFRGSVSEVLLRRLIEGTPPLPTLRHR